MIKAKNSRFEKPLPGNPHQFTLKQHIHAVSCIQRFATQNGTVQVYLKNRDHTFQARPSDPVFCAQRAWVQRLEHLRDSNGKVYPGFFSSIEKHFKEECDNILATGKITHHQIINSYLSIWRTRSIYAEHRPEDMSLVGVDDPGLSKEQEERLEANGVLFSRGGSIPSRNTTYVDAIRRHDMDMQQLSGRRWGIIKAFGAQGLICPDRPANFTCIPIDRRTMLCLGWKDRVILDSVCQRLNHSFLEQSRDYVFGYPIDVERTINGWVPTLCQL